MSRADAPANEWLVMNAAWLPSAGTALDVACGRGRNSFWLAERGLVVDAVDRDATAIAAVADEATARGLAVSAEVKDLEVSSPDLGDARYDVILVVHYLHRLLFPHLLAALRPRGVLIYETFTRAQARRGKPNNPDFLLDPGELRARTMGLTLLADREGTFGGREVASVVARKP
jgi:2-polyprenyl-3-methyl-5-hydroxy-6-metoxy-1,4-benzoquinol methylase